MPPPQPNPQPSSPTLARKVFQSSHIQAATYDPATRTMQIQFTNGRTYRNASDAPVPAKVWDAFSKSGSPGTFFDTEIRPMWGGIEVKKGSS